MNEIYENLTINAFNNLKKCNGFNYNYTHSAHLTLHTGHHTLDITHSTAEVPRLPAAENSPWAKTQVLLSPLASPPGGTARPSSVGSPGQRPAAATCPWSTPSSAAAVALPPLQAALPRRPLVLSWSVCPPAVLTAPTHIIRLFLLYTIFFFRIVM